MYGVSGILGGNEILGFIFFAGVPDSTFEGVYHSLAKEAEIKYVQRHVKMLHWVPSALLISPAAMEA